MPTKDSRINHLEGEAITGAALKALRATIQAVNSSIYNITSTKQAPPIDAYHPVQLHRENTQTLIANVQDQVLLGGELEGIIDKLLRRMYQKLRQHDFIIERLSILHKEKVIASLGENAQESTETVSFFMRSLIDPIFRRLGYNMAEIRHRRQLQYHIRQIIAKIDILTENPFFDKMSSYSRETYEQKWKHYAEKARALGIELPDSHSL